MRDLPEFVTINDKYFKLYLTPEKIDSIVSSLARQIEDDYSQKNPLFLLVLKGSIFFAADLLRKINLRSQLDTVIAKSYGDDIQSSGNVNLSITNLNVKGRDVIIVEDIVDSGLTLQSLINKIKKLEPESIETVALLSKPSQRTIDVKVKYIGKEIPGDFVIGYGLDIAEEGRQLPGIYIMSNEY